MGLNAPTRNWKDARFTFHTRRAVQSAIADLVGILAREAFVRLNRRPIAMMFVRLCVCLPTV